MKNNRVMQSAKRHRKLLLLALLTAVVFVLSSCYVDTDRIVDDTDGLNIGVEGQDFDVVITPKPVATDTPKPTEESQTFDWAEWDFSADVASDPPSGVVPTSASGSTVTAAPASATATPAPTTTTSATDSSVLQSGSTGIAVKQVQQELKDLGYYTGSVDGSYGAATAQAVKDFQSANGLTADGIAGNKTQDVLFSNYAIAKSTTSSGSTPSSSSGTTTTNTYTNGSTNIYLRLGSTGDQVKILQNRLIYLGYLAGAADSSFAETTEAGVVAFQETNGLTADGVAGPDTLKKLYSSTATKASHCVSYLGTLRVGMSGDGVRALQRRLRELDYYDHSIDGDFGQNTYASVLDFQTGNGISADGVAGKTTLNKMFSGTATTSSGSSSSGGSSSSSTASDPTIYGETAKSTGYSTMSSTNSPPSANVTSLQISLSSLGYYTGSLDGKFGSGTATAVTNYQVAHGLRNTGTAGPAMQRMLFGGTPATGSYSTLRPGDTGSDVRNLQYTLYELKYYDGAISGTYNETTENAVRDFQDVNNLSIDGVAGPATLALLYSSDAKALESEYE